MNISTSKVAAFTCLLTTLSLPAHATNGINLIGFGGESTLMAGADVAVARDTSALNTNPAGLAQIKGQRFNGFGSVLRTLDLSHQDQFGNNENASNRYTALGGGGYAMSLDSLPCTIGIGLFAQGGAGGVFKNINVNPALGGGQDRFSALFGIAKITPGIGCQVTDKLSLGISYGLVYASLDQKLFPNSSFQPANFYGYELKGANTIKTSFKIGMQYKATPQLTLGAAFTDKTKLPLSGGRISFNQTDAGNGIVTYRNASISGFALPREVAIGAAFQATDDLLLSLKLNWINWADAMKSSTLTATDPDSTSAYGPVFSANSALDWKNQWVIATGLAYKLNDKTMLYAGHNYGKNPVPTNTTTPNLAAILEHHYTFGAAYKFDPEWTFTGGIEYDPQVKVDYTNVQLPFGTNSELRNEALFLHFMVSREW
ncbi:OmpP1/FadL family transporter [Methyloradius palustris]|uniref:OmpP1/FadL family transporter n=1 Tax=Methyloradius palustris TaxID=2778876 RepID=UPI00298FE8D0|nr:outer membrane protein transport protein [Methyloradius palustris]